MKKFFGLIRRYGRLLDRLIYTKVEDLVSMRNTLILLTCIFCFLAIKTKDAVIVGTVFGCWTLILGCYFHYRQKTQENGGTHFKTTSYDDEVKKDEGQKDENGES